jgi:hypothetical protein
MNCPKCSSTIIYKGIFTAECSGQSCPSRAALKHRAEHLASRLGVTVVRDERGYLTFDVPDEKADAVKDVVAFVRSVEVSDVEADRDISKIVRGETRKGA